MYKSILYTSHIVYLLHVSVTRMTIFREVHYERQIHRNVTEVFEQMHKHKVFILKIKHGLKHVLKIKIR